MKYLVTYVELDGLDEVGDGIPEFSLSESEKIEITKDCLGVWEAEDEDDLVEEVTTASGFCVRKIDYEVQLK